MSGLLKGWWPSKKISQAYLERTLTNAGSLTRKGSWWARGPRGALSKPSFSITLTPFWRELRLPLQRQSKAPKTKGLGKSLPQLNLSRGWENSHLMALRATSTPSKSLYSSPSWLTIDSTYYLPITFVTKYFWGQKTWSSSVVIEEMSFWRSVCGSTKMIWKSN